MADGPLPAFESHSSISTYRGCPLRYGFRYVEHRRERFPRASSRSGTPCTRRSRSSGARASSPARRARFAEPGPELLRATLDARLATSGLAPDELDDARRRAVPVLARFLALESRLASEPVAVELGFGVDVALPDGGAPGIDAPGDGALGADVPGAAPEAGVGPGVATEPGAESIRFVGYVDRVDRAADGSTEIVDYKTGRARSQADVDVDAQLTAYAFGCAHGGLRDPATGAALPASRLGLYFADAGELAWTTRTAEQLAAFGAGLVETVGHIHAREFDGRPSSWRCRWCEYRRECPEATGWEAGAEPAALPSARR